MADRLPTDGQNATPLAMPGDQMNGAKRRRPPADGGVSTTQNWDAETPTGALPIPQPHNITLQHNAGALTVDWHTAPNGYEVALVRGRNDWIYLSLGLFDTRGLDHVFFALADDELYEGVFDQSRFDHALFPSGPAARLALSWVETTPAAFEVRVPRYLVAEPSELAAAGEAPPWQRVAEGLESSLAALHAAGVSSALSFVPFVETQPQQVRVALPWVRLEPEAGPAGRDEALSLGGRFGESTFGGTRFE